MAGAKNDKVLQERLQEELKVLCRKPGNSSVLPSPRLAVLLRCRFASALVAVRCRLLWTPLPHFHGRIGD